MSQGLTEQDLEKLLETVCNTITAECQRGILSNDSAAFEARVRKELNPLVVNLGITIALEPQGQAFPDISLGKLGVEVKFTTGDSWRSVANSIFEGTRDRKIEKIYVVFGKMGGNPEVRWGRYEECVIHVRTSHVPRFEVEVPPQRPSLFQKFKISYADFCRLSEHERMEHVRRYAHEKIKHGEKLWWLEDKPDEGHALELGVRRWRLCPPAEKRKLRAEAYLLCPEILEYRQGRQPKDLENKYDNALLYLLTYRGVLADRDPFSAGSVGGIKKSLIKVETEIKAAALELPDQLFVEYWRIPIAPSPEFRIKEWLMRADFHAQKSANPWKPSELLFKAG